MDCFGEISECHGRFSRVVYVDNNGNLLSKTDGSDTTTFTWNEENQLTQVTLPGGLFVNHKYDGLGRRLQRTTSAGASELAFAPEERDVYSYERTPKYLAPLGAKRCTGTFAGADKSDCAPTERRNT